jgi:hypothetical protein
MKKNLLLTALGLIMCIMAFPQTTVTITNPGFEDPDDDIKYTTLSNGDIPGWMTDDTRDNFTGREAGTGLDITGKYWCYMNGNAGEVYQADVDVIPATATRYILTFNARVGWVSNAGDTIYSETYFDAYSGTDATTRVKFDSIRYDGWPIGPQNLGTATLVDTLDIPAASPQAGKHLCIGYSMRNMDTTRHSADWGQIDSFSMTKQALVAGLSKVTSSSFSIFPNPSKGTFQLKNASIGTDVEVFDYTGKLIESFKLKGNDVLNINNKGVYMIRATSGNNRAIQKLIIE